MTTINTTLAELADDLAFLKDVYPAAPVDAIQGLLKNVGVKAPGPITIFSKKEPTKGFQINITG